LRAGSGYHWPGVQALEALILGAVFNVALWPEQLSGRLAHDRLAVAKPKLDVEDRP